MFFAGKSFEAFTKIFFSFGSSPCCQYTNVGLISSAVGMFVRKVRIVVAFAGVVSSFCTVTVLVCKSVSLPMVYGAVISPFLFGFTSIFWLCIAVQYHSGEL